MKWFRAYSDIVDDEKIRLLAFEDRWHFVAILALKSAGLLDEPATELRERRIAMKLGLTPPEAHQVKTRLMAVTLIDDDWQPNAWNRRQYKHDDSSARVKKWREKQADSTVKPPVTVTVTSTDTDTDTEKTKSKRRAFCAPTQKQVTDHCSERGYSFSPIAFFSHYESNGWKVGRSPMKNWQAACVTWQSKEGQTNGQLQRSVIDNSAAGRVRANVARDRAARAGTTVDRDDMALDGEYVGSQVCVELRGRA